MKLIFNNDTIDISLNDCPISQLYQHCCRHLQHIPIPFRSWDDPFYFENAEYSDIVNVLVTIGIRLGIDVDIGLALSRDQLYFNHLHKIFEQNYNGDPDWLEFHEHLHLCETQQHNSTIIIDHRELAGLLERPMQKKWLENRSTQVQKGDVYIGWSELGKHPYSYWYTNEPENLDRMCELARPWVKFVPKIWIAVKDVDFLEGLDHSGFNQWWTTYQETWCQHWGLESYELTDMFSVAVIGHVDNIDSLITLIQNKNYPTHLSLD